MKKATLTATVIVLILGSVAGFHATGSAMAVYNFTDESEFPDSWIKVYFDCDPVLFFCFNEWKLYPGERETRPGNSGDLSVVEVRLGDTGYTLGGASCEVEKHGWVEVKLATLPSFVSAGDTFGSIDEEVILTVVAYNEDRNQTCMDMFSDWESAGWVPYPED